MQLRRYLDDQAYLENRRIMEVLHGIEVKALAVRNLAPAGDFMEVDETAPSLELPMERPLYSPPVRPVIADHILVDGDENVAAEALFDQVIVDKARLAARVRQALQARSQVTLAELLDAHPLEQGLAELVAYLTLASGDHKGVFDEQSPDTVYWQDTDGMHRQATLPRVIFVK